MIDKDKETDDQELEDDADDGASETAEKSVKETNDKDYRKVSIREAITDAVEENTKEDDKEPPKKEKKVEAKEEDQDNKEIKEEGDDKKVSTQPKVKAPPGWTKEGKAAWSSLAPDIQNSVIKREKEFSDGIAQYSTKAKAYDELESVIAPRREAIKRFGVSEAQTVDRLFSWFERLGNSDPEIKHDAFKALAANFGADLSRFAPQQQTQQTNTNPQQETDPTNKLVQDFNQALDKRFSTIDNRFQTYEQQLASQQQAASKREAEAFINSWSNGKTHFEKVRKEMFGLIQGDPQTYIKQDGTLDLDKAYERAVRANDEVFELYQEEKAEEARQDALKKQRAEKEKIEKARRAGSSLKSAAPTGSLNGNKLQAKSNGKAAPSAGESIRAALAELRENQ